MNQYKWTHEFQIRRGGVVYEVRYLVFQSKVFYYNEAKTSLKVCEVIGPLTFNSLLRLAYSSYLPFNKFDLSRNTSYRSMFEEALIENAKYGESWILQKMRKDDGWRGGSYIVPVDKIYDNIEEGK